MLAEVERTGFPVDMKQRAVEQVNMDKDLKLLQQAVCDLSDGEITKPGSLIQVRKYLFTSQKRKIVGWTDKGAPRVDKETLRQNNDLPAIAALQGFRRVRKMKTSYLDNLPKYVVVGPDGVPRAHANFKFWNVVTHRLAVEDPALQTIPHRDAQEDTISDLVVEHVRKTQPAHNFDGDYGNRIKGCYIASPGNTLVGADGKFWEVACATVQSKDKFLADIINSGKDPHSGLCDKLYGPGWTKADRVREKNVFFGWIYGGSAAALAYDTGLPFADVRAVLDFLDAHLVDLKKWRLDLQRDARSGKIILPVLNYHFHWDLITEQVLKDLPKHAVNYPNQGLGSMLICRAAIKAQPQLARFGAKIVMLVHDSFYADTPVKYTDDAAHILHDTIVEAGAEFSKFITWGADVEVGTRWNKMEEYYVG
jgi:DNA polymerase-1